MNPIKKKGNRIILVQDPDESYKEAHQVLSKYFSHSQGIPTNSCGGASYSQQSRLIQQKNPNESLKLPVRSRF